MRQSLGLVAFDFTWIVKVPFEVALLKNRPIDLIEIRQIGKEPCVGDIGMLVGKEKGNPLLLQPVERRNKMTISSLSR